VSVVQLAILITVFAPFILAVWVAFMHWVQARRNPRGPTSGTDGFGSVRSRFAAKRPGVFARPKFVRFGLAIDRCGTVRVDPSVLRGALRSLIGTTTRSTSSGQVPVTSLTRGRQMHVRVVDDGVGTDRMSHESRRAKRERWSRCRVRPWPLKQGRITARQSRSGFCCRRAPGPRRVTLPPRAFPSIREFDPTRRTHSAGGRRSAPRDAADIESLCAVGSTVHTDRDA
jgi:hypothetical protein